jgi:hypothetical protein
MDVLFWVFINNPFEAEEAHDGRLEVDFTTGAVIQLHF